MEYLISGTIDAGREATFSVREQSTSFGILEEQQARPNPAELLLGAFAACCLKNVQRFSGLLGFSYESARIEVTGTRQEKPTKINAIRYIIYLQSTDNRLNPELLHKNLRKFGTIYNTLKETCEISGELKLLA